MLTFDRGARPDAQCPSEVIGKLRVVVGVVDGEHAIFGTLTVEVPLRIRGYESYLSSLRSSRVRTAEEVRTGSDDPRAYLYLRRQYIDQVRWLRQVLLVGSYCPYCEV